MSIKTLSEFEVAALCGWTLKTLRNNRLDGTGPVSCRLSRKTVVYLDEDVDAWLRSRRETKPATLVEG
jgi:predicted DNA-binding transcriptional regulator AlpA